MIAVWGAAPPAIYITIGLEKGLAVAALYVPSWPHLSQVWTTMTSGSFVVGRGSECREGANFGG